MVSLSRFEQYLDHLAQGLGHA
ncbi:MAG: hypothetical protein QOF74_5504, partial [Caballeronia mineralivorans]|nr:hypothetical protein [Caballeronia mineralivorans]MEA3101264.1 hypothetical protein [Caballeronia mineralivorans]